MPDVPDDGQRDQKRETAPTVVVAGRPHTGPRPAPVRGQLSRRA
ncbi:hypothetical protein [Streptomyces humidus]|nr:hypothetical protein [Streptomyces humidus]